MKYAIRTVLFHMVCILWFAWLYHIYKHDFVTSQGDNIDEFDCLFLATTIQAGVGYTTARAETTTSKLLLMMQQWCMISANVFLLYFLSSDSFGR